MMKIMKLSFEKLLKMSNTPIYGYNSMSDSWHCVLCGIDMGTTNPRQFCCKTYCGSLIAEPMLNYYVNSESQEEKSNCIILNYDLNNYVDNENQEDKNGYINCDSYEEKIPEMEWDDTKSKTDEMDNDETVIQLNIDDAVLLNIIREYNNQNNDFYDIECSYTPDEKNNRKRKFSQIESQDY